MPPPRPAASEHRVRVMSPDIEMEQELPEVGTKTVAKKWAQTLNKLKAEDDADVAGIVKVTREALKCLEMCAQAHLPGLTAAIAAEESSETKKERKGALKRYHKIAEETVETRLKSLPLAIMVHQVYEDMDLDTLANQEEDDEQFIKMMEEFEEACRKKIEEESRKVTMEVIDQDEEYQNFLEMLNPFINHSKSASSKPQQEVEDEQPGTSSPEIRRSEGLAVPLDYIPIRDPITQELLTDPYVNQVCKHVYEFNTAIQMIQIGKFKCPYAGCTNTAVVRASDLVEDGVMARKIKEQIRIYKQIG